MYHIALSSTKFSFHCYHPSLLLPLLCQYVCQYGCVCVSVCTYTHVYYTYVKSDVCIHNVLTHTVCVHTCIHTYVYKHYVLIQKLCTYVHMCVSMCMWCMCEHACAGAHIDMYTVRINILGICLCVSFTHPVCILLVLTMGNECVHITHHMISDSLSIVCTVYTV